MRGMHKDFLPVPAGTGMVKTNLRQTLGYMWPYLWEFKGRALLAVMALLAAKGATLLMPWALKHIIDGVDPSLHATVTLPLTFILFYGSLRFAGVFFSELRDALFSRITEHSMRKMSLRIFRHLHQLELAFH